MSKHLLKRVSSTITVTPYWAKTNAVRYKKRSYCITNGYEPAEYQNIDAYVYKEKFVISYSGSIHNTQNIDVFFKGLELLVNKQHENFGKLQFVYMGHSSDHIHKLVSKYKLNQHVKILKHIDREEVIKYLLGSSLLLLLSIDTNKTDDSVLKKGVIPGKVFEYFAIKKPILCVPGDHGVLDDIVNKSKTGMICDNPENIAKYIEDAIEEWVRNGSVSYNPDQLVIKTYQRESQTRFLSSILDNTKLHNKSINQSV